MYRNKLNNDNILVTEVWIVFLTIHCFNLYNTHSLRNLILLSKKVDIVDNQPLNGMSFKTRLLKSIDYFTIE